MFIPKLLLTQKTPPFEESTSAYTPPKTKKVNKPIPISKQILDTLAKDKFFGQPAIFKVIDNWVKNRKSGETIRRIRK